MIDLSKRESVFNVSRRYRAFNPWISGAGNCSIQRLLTGIDRGARLVFVLLREQIRAPLQRIKHRAHTSDRGRSIDPLADILTPVVVAQRLGIYAPCYRSSS